MLHRTPDLGKILSGLFSDNDLKSYAISYPVSIVLETPGLLGSSVHLQSVKPPKLHNHGLYLLENHDMKELACTFLPDELSHGKNLKTCK